jgi:arylsulfatase A-like enzyme
MTIIDIIQKLKCCTNLREKKYYGFFIFCFSIIAFSGCKKDFSEQEGTSSSGVQASRTSSKPNIILFISNDFGFELPNYNGGEYRTPNLDFLADNGLHFRQCYNHPDGSPSRIAILTGKYNFRNYVNWGILPPGEKTIGNMLHDAGYATCWVGKWQLSGADKRILSAGFDKYRVFLPKGHGQREHRYKDPKLYENGDYLPDNVTKGQYSEDMLYDYLKTFIHQNKSKPFFAIYATLLPAKPWVPTPDDPEFKTCNSDNDLTMSDQKYFPSMVTYMDKIVGKVRKKLENEGIANNTIIMFTSATQTDSRITSTWRGQEIAGTKTTTSKAGTNIPLLVYWPTNIAGGQKNNTLIDFTDFLPTLADVAHIPVPNNYGTLDGTSFYDNMTGVTGKDRKWVFCQWDNNPLDDVPVERFINDRIYKLYDTVGEGNGKFYNIADDMWETHPIPNDKLTPEERQKKNYFRSILDTMHN